MRAYPWHTPDQVWKYHLRYQYQLTVEQYEIMFAEQEGLCAICHRPEASMQHGKVQRLGVDHNHETGKVRALLCRRCNRMVGQEEVEQVLRDQIRAYIESWR